MKGRTSVARGAAFTLATRWADRVIGIASTVILARILVPEDFGIIAMASLVIGLVDVFLDLGVAVALIQNSAPTKEHYDAAWTLRLAQTALATLVVIAAAPLAAGYFRDARIEPVLQVLAFSLLLSGLENIGVVTFQKEMRFGQDFRFAFGKRLAGFVVTIVAAWLMQSYWALVVGTLAGRLFGVLLSYRMHAMRPRLGLAHARDIFGVSQWMLVRGIGGFLDLNLHKWIVGGRAPASLMGAYSLADEIAFLPASVVLIPLNRVLFPAFVTAKDNLPELQRMFLLAQGVQSLVGIPMAAGLVLVADEIVRVLLGEKWLAAVPFVQWLSLCGVVTAITTSGGYVLLTLGRFRTMAIFTWVRVAVFAAVAYLVLPGAGALAIAWLRVGFASAALATFVVWLRKALPALRLAQLAACVVRPLVATFAMTGAVLALDAWVTVPVVAMLLLKVAAGASCYVAAIFALWLAAGKPAGAEAYLLEKAGIRRP